MTARDHTLPAIIAAVIKKRITAAHEAHRAAMAVDMRNGERFVAVDPDHPELVLGEVLRTRPEAKAVIVDWTAFTKWMAAEYPDRVQTVLTLPSANMEQAIEVLHAYAPHLLAGQPVVLDWAEAEVLACTKRARQACGPGGELDVPGVEYVPGGPGVVTVKPSADAHDAIERMWREGRIDLRTGELLEIRGAPCDVCGKYECDGDEYH